MIIFVCIYYVFVILLNISIQGLLSHIITINFINNKLKDQTPEGLSALIGSKIQRR